MMAIHSFSKSLPKLSGIVLLTALMTSLVSAGLPKPEQQEAIEEQQSVNAKSAKSSVSGEAEHRAVGPEAAKSKNWEFVVNNAIHAIDKYAVGRNPNAVFFGPGMKVEFLQQRAGKHKGRYLLKLLNEHGGNVSFAMLLPLFDENAPTDGLDDESNLWEIVVAKYNGREF